MADLTRQILKVQADYIRKKMEGGFFYGVPIEMDNEDARIVAAYIIGQQEERQALKGEYDRLRALMFLQS